MQPIEILMEEHRVIEQVLDCLEIIAQRCADGGQLDVESAGLAIDFFRNFADRCHHGKEEDCLFPMLERKGFPAEQGPTGVMRDEHTAGRRHIQAMSAAIVALHGDDARQRENDFSSHAREYVLLLREHILKEDNCLFQMANEALNDTEMRQLHDAFHRVEHDDLGPAVHEKYLRIAAELADRFGVRSNVASLSDGSSCCHGEHSAGDVLPTNHRIAPMTENG